MKKKESTVDTEYRYCSNRKCIFKECSFYIKNAPFDVKIIVSDYEDTDKGKKQCGNYRI